MYLIILNNKTINIVYVYYMCVCGLDFKKIYKYSTRYP